MRSWLSAVLLLVSSLAIPAQAEWRPEKPVRIIVPWSAGGSTDQLIRILAVEEGIASLGRQEIDRLKLDSRAPLVVEVPGPGGPVEERQTALELVRRVLGISV